jgi:hypothetical protein
VFTDLAVADREFLAENAGDLRSQQPRRLVCRTVTGPEYMYKPETPACRPKLGNFCVLSGTIGYAARIESLVLLSATP